MNYDLYIVTGLLATILVVREYQYWRNINLLMDRFMATDFRQYKIMTREKSKAPQVRKPMSDEQAAVLEDQQNGTLRNISDEIDEATRQVQAGVGAS